jgi:hypothetical protein
MVAILYGLPEIGCSLVPDFVCATISFVQLTLVNFSMVDLLQSSNHAQVHRVLDLDVPICWQAELEAEAMILSVQEYYLW